MDSKEIIERMDHDKRTERIDYMDHTKEIKNIDYENLNERSSHLLEVQNFTHTWN